jgi:hypothetical protein
MRRIIVTGTELWTCCTRRLIAIGLLEDVVRRRPVPARVRRAAGRGRAAADGCFFAPDGQKKAGAARVETDARRRLVHDRRLLARGGGKLSATGCNLGHDGSFDAPVGCAVAGRARQYAADACEESTVDRRDTAVARPFPASGCAVPADG